MSKILLILSLVSVFISSCACGTNKKADNATYDTLYLPKYAERFEVLENQDSVILRVRNPWQGAQGVVYDYALSKTNARLQRVVCMSSSHLAYIDALGKVDNVVGVSGLDFITNPKVHAANLPDVGYDGNLNSELVVALQPDCVFVYEVTGENGAVTQKLRQLGIKVIYVADYLESSPLARAEWLVAFGAIFGQLEQAQHRVERIVESYNLIKDSVERIAALKPKVMLNTPYRDVWYLPGDRSYMVQLINDAGGDYLAKGTDNDISRPVSVEVAYDLLTKADIWLNPSAGIKDLEQLKAENHRFASLEVMRKGNVYNNDARSTPMGGSDFWESGSLNADVVLRDLAKLFHKQYFENEQLYYYRKLK